MFLKSAWYVAGWSSEFGAGELHARTLVDEPLVLIRGGDGALVAMTDRCPHRWAPLSRGRIEGDTIRCMYHGLRFALDGRCVEIPGQPKASPALNNRVYPVIERHKWAWIWMGDPGKAEPALIPDVGLLDDESKRVFRGRLDYDVDYRLINDNLLDLSHVGFVHENTLGRGIKRDGPPPPNANGMAARTSGAAARQIDRGVRADAWVPHKTALMPEAAAPGDVWIRTDYMVPGIFIQRVALFPKGTAKGLGFKAPGEQVEPVVDGMSCQAVTPISERSTRYFYAAGNRASDMGTIEAEAKFKIVEEAFREDQAMIGAQQRMIDRHPGKRMNWINADRGLTLFRSLMERLMAAEAGPLAAADARAGEVG